MSANTARRTTANTLTRDLTPTNKHLTCPDCGGVNGVERLNQPCDFCGFVLKVRLFPDHDRYVRGLDVTASGRDTYDIADETADSLRGLDADEVLEAVAKALAQLPMEHGLSVKLGRQYKKQAGTWDAPTLESWLASRYEGRNPGMIRMNCGNVLRSAAKRARAAAEGEA